MTARILMRDPLARRSVNVLKLGQARSGAFVASPAFPVYRYGWLRDGAFCAYALDLVGERDRVKAFHDWAAGSVESHRGLFHEAIAGVEAGEVPSAETMPPARYTLDGTLEQPTDEPWPNFQIDGYGMWLWSLGEHLGGSRSPADLRPIIELVARYLQATWQLSCFSCWEELDGGEHASTLAAVAAGLDVAARLLDDERWAEEAGLVRASLLDRFTTDGRFKRGPSDERLDGSLLWLAVPFGVLPVDDPLIVGTVEAVRRELTGPNGGVYRYLGDTYYGGGEWLLLTSSLAWYDALSGNGSHFGDAQEWVRAHALPNRDLPEQVPTRAQEPAMVEEWLQRWGPIATPLLWSHAMYLIAEDASAA